MERSLKTVSQTEDFSNRPPGSVEMTEELVSGAVEMAEELVSGAVEMAGELVSGSVETTEGDAPNPSSRLEAEV